MDNFKQVSRLPNVYIFSIADGGYLFNTVGGRVLNIARVIAHIFPVSKFGGNFMKMLKLEKALSMTRDSLKSRQV